MALDQETTSPYGWDPDKEDRYKQFLKGGSVSDVPESDESSIGEDFDAAPVRTKSEPSTPKYDWDPDKEARYQQFIGRSGGAEPSPEVETQPPSDYGWDPDKEARYQQFLKGEGDFALDQPDPAASGASFAPERGFVGDVVSRGARGVSHAVKGVAGAMRMSDLDPTQETGVVAKAGKRISDFMGQAEDNYDILKPDESEAQQKEGFVKRGAMGAVESIPASLMPLAGGYAGAKAGGAIGAALAPFTGGISIPIGATLGGLAGAGATLFGTFGAGEYQNTYDETVETLRKKGGLSETEIHDKANKHALVSATAEVGGEAVGDIAAYTFFGLFGKQAIKQTTKQTIRQLLSAGGVKEFGKALAKTIPFEAGSEVGTAYFQTKSAKEAGVSDISPEEGMKEAVLPAVFMSLMFGGSIRGMQAVEAKSVYTKLNSDSQEERVAAAEVIAKRLDPEERGLWVDTANKFIETGEDIPISKPIADLAAQQPTDKATSPADALTGDPAADLSNREELNSIGEDGELSEPAQNKLDGIRQDLESTDPESLTVDQVEELINTPEYADISPQLKEIVTEKRQQAEGVSVDQTEDAVDLTDLERKFYEDPLDIDNTEAYWEALTAESEQVSQSMAEGRFVPADTLRRHPDLVNEADIIEDVDRGQTAVEDQAGDERSIFQSTLNRIADHNKLEGPEREDFLKTRLDEYDAQAAETEAQAQADSKRENFAGAVSYIADKQNLKGPEREAFIQGRLDEYDARAKAPAPSPYFKESDRAETVPLKDIQAREPLSTPEQKKSLEHAKKLMADAVAGKGEKRDPISVYEREDGVTVVVDGNTTYHALQELGEKNIAVNRVASPVQQSESMEEIYAQAEASRGDIKKVTENIATDFGGTAHFRPGEALKSKSRAQDKVDKKYGTPAKLKDILASTVSFPDQKQVMKALDGFLKNGAVVEVKNKFKNTPASGYRDISMTVRMPNGHLTEIQFTTDSLLKAKNAAGHVMYELSRELDKMDVPGAREVQARLDKLSREYYEAAFEAPANFNALSSDIGIPLYRISNELSESIKTRLSPSSLNNLRDLLSKTKGVPSESKKVSDIKSPPSSKKVTQSESGVKYITENKKVKVKALNKKGEVVSRVVPADKAIKDNAQQRDSLEKLLTCME